MKVYLAGPLGFSEAGRFYQDTVLIPALAQAGHEIINPWKLTEQRKIDAVGRGRVGKGAFFTRRAHADGERTRGQNCARPSDQLGHARQFCPPYGRKRTSRDSISSVD